jgi:large subunit ribosomal protein L3
MRAAGHMGNEKVTVQNLKIVRIQGEENLLVVRGAVPGRNGGYVIIQRA